MQEKRNSSALAIELRLSYINPSNWWLILKDKLQGADSEYFWEKVLCYYGTKLYNLHCLYQIRMKNWVEAAQLNSCTFTIAIQCQETVIMENKIHIQNFYVYLKQPTWQMMLQNAAKPKDNTVNLSLNTQKRHQKIACKGNMHRMPLWVLSLIEVLHSSVQCCMQYKVMLNIDWIEIYSEVNHWCWWSPHISHHIRNFYSQKMFDNFYSNLNGRKHSLRHAVSKYIICIKCV